MVAGPFHSVCCEATAKESPMATEAHDPTSPEAPSGLSRRGFLFDMGLLATATALLHTPGALGSPGWLETAEAGTTDLVRDTFNGLLAFVVPGPDDYSVAQGVSTAEPGGVDANVTDVFIETLDASTPFLPHFSAVVATILNDLALVVDPSAGGPFPSAFSRLSFGEKVRVVQIMDGTDALAPLAGILPAFAAYLAYSEAGVLDRRSRSLTGQPVGWTISAYQGVSDGRDELQGYLDGRRKARRSEKVERDPCWTSS